MLLKSDAYKACVDYFIDNLSIFDNENENENNNVNANLIANIIILNTSNMLMTFCEQQPQLDTLTRNSVIADGDLLIEELEHILGRFWNKAATAEQEEFLNEYFLLLKNSLDSQV